MTDRWTADGASGGNARPAVCTAPIIGLLIRNLLLLRPRAAG